jgi:oligosaccharide repeat unit polymerase
VNFIELTSQEQVPFFCLATLIIGILIVNYVKGYANFWSPLTIASLVFGYYCLIGPYQAISTGETYDRLKNMRPYYAAAFWGAFAMLLSIVAGFLINPSKSQVEKRQYPDELLSKYGKRVFLIGFIIFTISTGGNVGKLINPLDAEAVESVGGGFKNYLALCLNFLIPGVTLLFAYFIKTRKGFAWFIIPFVVALGIFTTLGFRYRIVLLFVSLVITYYYILKKRPNLILLSVSIVAFIIFMGIINITRQYGRGLNVSKLNNKSTRNYYESGLREAMIFQTSGAIIDFVPSRHSYTGMQIIWSTLLFPIPNSFYKDKNSAGYIFDALNIIYGKKYSKGAAMMSYGEYYLSFGWAGIIAGGLLIGWLFRSLWNWFLLNNNNGLVIVVYAVTTSYLYFVISRGYLPLIANLFLFSVLPVYVVFWIAKKNSARLN